MKLVQQMPGGDNMKAFTRIMHRTTDDDLVGEVRWHTVHCGTVVIQLSADQGALAGKVSSATLSLTPLPDLACLCTWQIS
jgi:hypothetical protein